MRAVIRLNAITIHPAWAIPIQTLMDNDFWDVEQGGFSITKEIGTVLMRMNEEYEPVPAT